MHIKLILFSSPADGSSGFKAEGDRYHLYVSLACPFAHRVLIFRKLKGLEDVLPYTVLDYIKGPEGWTFCDDVNLKLNTFFRKFSPKSPEFSTEKNNLCTRETQNIVIL